jgi:hypothetical protein
MSASANYGGGGFGGGSVGNLPSLPVGDRVFIDFEWIFDKFKSIITSFGTLFDLMFNPLYTWIDYVFSWFGFSEKYIESVIENISTMKFFQLTFFDLLFYGLPVVICIILLLWVFNFKNTSLIGPF